MDLNGIGKRRSSAEIKQKLVSILLWAATIEGAYVWISFSLLGEGMTPKMGMALFSFSVGLYNVLGFFFGFVVYTIGGTDNDYDDRPMGLVFGLMFMFMGIILPVRF